MRHGKDLENKPIISLTEGRMLGRAKDVYVDDQVTQLAGLYLGSEGMLRRRAQVISSEDVVLFGIDVVLVKDSDVIAQDKDMPGVKDWLRLKDLQGYEVHTSGGTKLATVGDIILDESGAVVGLDLSRVFVKGPLAEQATVPREVILECAHKDEIIRVDLAMLEGMVIGMDEPDVEAEAADAEAVDEESVEEISIDIDESDEQEGKVKAEDASVSEDVGVLSITDDAVDFASDEQE